MSWANRSWEQTEPYALWPKKQPKNCRCQHQAPPLYVQRGFSIFTSCCVTCSLALQCYARCTIHITGKRRNATPSEIARLLFGRTSSSNYTFCLPHVLDAQTNLCDIEKDVLALYGAGAETLIFVTGTSGKYSKLFVSRQKNQSQLWIPRKPRKIGVWVCGAEIQTSAVDTRTAVWVSTAEKFSKIVLGKTRNFSRNFGGVSAPDLYKNPAVSLAVV